MKRAYLNLRFSLTERIEAFEGGLRVMGFEPIRAMPNPHDHAEEDVFVTWNRIGSADDLARSFVGAVLVAENASWGNGFQGGQWLTLARNYHNTRRMNPIFDKLRWDKLNVSCETLRNFPDESGRYYEIVMLPSRGIGTPPTAQPRDWLTNAFKKYRHARMRQHPGKFANVEALREDLKHAHTVITWGSGAAIHAAIWGCKVVFDMPNWIGAHRHDEESRLQMLRELANHQFTLEEIKSGFAFDILLNR